jgi:hypothetical protein
LGIPWPDDPELAKNNATKDGWMYNCYVNKKVEELFVPRLEEALKERMRLFGTKAVE